ncbi:hypothetical protein DRB05_09640 [Pseudoalteromonas sp. A757]|nr:hypothetical protein DRB05_09640 [Pseudoalteromonas sp. A757]
MKLKNQLYEYTVKIIYVNFIRFSFGSTLLLGIASHIHTTSKCKMRRFNAIKCVEQAKKPTNSALIHRLVEFFTFL